MSRCYKEVNGACGQTVDVSVALGERFSLCVLHLATNFRNCNDARWITNEESVAIPTKRFEKKSRKKENTFTFFLGFPFKYLWWKIEYGKQWSRYRSFWHHAPLWHALFVLGELAEQIAAAWLSVSMTTVSHGLTMGRIDVCSRNECDKFLGVHRNRNKHVK